MYRTPALRLRKLNKIKGKLDPSQGTTLTKNSITPDSDILFGALIPMGRLNAA